MYFGPQYDMNIKDINLNRRLSPIFINGNNGQESEAAAIASAIASRRTSFP